MNQSEVAKRKRKQANRNTNRNKKRKATVHTLDHCEKINKHLEEKLENSRQIVSSTVYYCSAKGNRDVPKHDADDMSFPCEKRCGSMHFKDKKTTSNY
jgi:hypothetical protein